MKTTLQYIYLHNVYKVILKTPRKRNRPIIERGAYYGLFWSSLDAKIRGLGKEVKDTRRQFLDPYFSVSVNHT